MFRMLKLKPPHGWNAVAWELAIVFVGVLMALGAQQIVDGIQKRNDRAQLVAALRAELADDRARWQHIQEGDPCSLKRLDAIERWNAAAPANATLPSPYRLFLWNMHSSAWDLGKTSSATQDIPLDQRLTYAALYGAIEKWGGLLDEESENARALSALIETAGAPDRRSQVAQRLAKARYYVTRRQFNYEYLFARFDRLRIAPDERELTARVDDRRLCAPLG